MTDYSELPLLLHPRIQWLLGDWKPVEHFKTDPPKKWVKYLKKLTNKQKASCEEAFQRAHAVHETAFWWLHLRGTEECTVQWRFTFTMRNNLYPRVRGKPSKIEKEKLSASLGLTWEGVALLMDEAKILGIEDRIGESIEKFFE